jgi:subtilisin family serine protease
MRWIVRALLLAVFVGATAIFDQAMAQQSPSRDFVPGEIIVGFKSPDDAASAIKDLQAAQGSGEVQTRGGAQSSIVKVERLDATSARVTFDFRKGGAELRGTATLPSLEETAELYREDPRVKYAHPNWIMQLQRPRIQDPVHLEDVKLEPRIGTSNATQSGPDDPVFQNGLHWHYASPPTGMNAINAWANNITGDKSVVVAVIDTGILPEHPDINSGNLVPGYDFISRPQREGDTQPGRDADPTDPGDYCPERSASGDSWHGTHVAGTIGAASTNNKLDIASINWAVSVLPVRVLGRCGGTIDDLAAAVRWSAGLEVKDTPINAHKADVVNLSLSIRGACVVEDYGVLIEAISAARRAGTTIVVAAGNQGVDIKDITPASCRDVISVAASDRRGHLAPYSNYGMVTVMAPGGDLKRDDDGDGSPDGIWSLVATSPTHPSGAAASEGTSMAAPHVSAAIALTIAKNAGLRNNPQAIAALLTNSVAPLPSDACSAPCGPGLLDAAAMIAPPTMPAPQ